MTYHPPENREVGKAGRFVAVLRTALGGELPTAILEALETRRRIEAAMGSATAGTVDAVWAVASQITAQARSGPVGDLEKLTATAIEAERKSRIGTIVDEALRQARLDAGQALVSAVRSSAPGLVDRLRSRHDQLLEEVRQVAKTLAGASLADPVSLDEPARQAYMRLRELVSAWSAVADVFARVALDFIGQPVMADNGWSRFRNAPAVYGDRWAGRRLTGWTPWPEDDAVAYLVWLSGGARMYAAAVPEPWLPLSSDWEAAATAHRDAQRAAGVAVAIAVGA